MIKGLLVFAVVASGLFAGSAYAASSSSEESVSYCSAETIDADGRFNPYVRTECDSEYAGRCLKAAADNAQTYWEVVDQAVCDKAAAEQGF